MSENGTLAELLREMYGGEPWHGPPFRDLLEDLTPEQAAAHPIAGAHSIWELVVHCDAWQRIVRMRLLGGPYEVTPEQDWPAVPETTAAAWREALEAVEESAQRLREMFLRQDPWRFQPGAGGYDHRLHLNAHGSIAHLAYHGGQIVLLRRALGLAPVAVRPMTE